MRDNQYFERYVLFKYILFAYKIQENIKNNIVSMVDMRVSKINVHIVGVDFKNEETRNQMKLMQEKTNDYIENRKTSLKELLENKYN